MQSNRDIVNAILAPIVARGGTIRAKSGKLLVNVSGGLSGVEGAAIMKHKPELLEALSDSLFCKLPGGTYKYANPPTVDEVLAMCRREGWDMGPSVRSEAA